MTKSPTARFSDRVENYVRYRPGYTLEVLDLLRAECGLRPSHIVADIASGTGVFTRLLLENGNSVFAVEPNPEMREMGIQQLESKDGIPILQKKAGEYASTRSDVSDEVTRLQPAFGAKKVQNLKRISRTITDVVLHPIRKTRRWRLGHRFLV